MTEMEKRTAAKEFAAYRKDRGDEKQETQSFWMALLQKVFGVAEPDKFIDFEELNNSKTIIEDIETVINIIDLFTFFG